MIFDVDKVLAPHEGSKKGLEHSPFPKHKRDNKKLMSIDSGKSKPSDGGNKAM